MDNGLTRRRPQSNSLSPTISGRYFGRGGEGQGEGIEDHFASPSPRRRGEGETCRRYARIIRSETLARLRLRPTGCMFAEKASLEIPNPKHQIPNKCKIQTRMFQTLLFRLVKDAGNDASQLGTLLNQTVSLGVQPRVFVGIQSRSNSTKRCGGLLSFPWDVTDGCHWLCQCDRMRSVCDPVTGRLKTWA